MANTFGTDVLIQSPDPKAAASFHVNNVGFEISGETPELVSLLGSNINLFIEPVRRWVRFWRSQSKMSTRQRSGLVQAGCTIVKDEPTFPRCYVRDPFGLIYNLRA
jgi:hypothetical protein